MTEKQDNLPPQDAPPSDAEDTTDIPQDDLAEADLEDHFDQPDPQEPDEDDPESYELDRLDPQESDDVPLAPPDDLDDFPEVEITTSGIVEAILFAADEPIAPNRIAEIAGLPGVKEVRDIVVELNGKYQQATCAFRIESIAGGYQMLTLSPFNTWLSKLLKVRSETKLSPAALETLAIISYKQPILRVDIEAIRGVACGEMVRQLCDKGLVKIVGRAEVIGRPLLYGTTKRFLQVFGLNSLKDLPSAEDLNWHQSVQGHQE